MSWYHLIATFLNHSLPQLRATRRTNLALLTAAVLERRTLALSILTRAWFCQLPYSHHQRKKRLFRFLSNDRFDPMAVQTALLEPICQAAGLRGLTPIMIDWSDLGRGRNGLFAAVCFRRRGLPLLSWVAQPEELNPSQNRLEESFLIRLLRHLPDSIQPLLLCDRGFGRASLLRFLQQMPRYTGYPAPYVIRLKGNAIIQTEGFRGRLGNYPLPKGRIQFLPRVHYRSDGAVVTNLVLYWGRKHQEPWYLATSLSDPHRVVGLYRRRMQPEQYFRDGKQRFGLDSSTVTTTSRLQRLLVAALLACCLLIIAGTRAPADFRRQVCSWGKLGILHLGWEYYLANPHPPPRIFIPSSPQTGYAWAPLRSLLGDSAFAIS